MVIYRVKRFSRNNYFGLEPMAKDLLRAKRDQISMHLNTGRNLIKTGLTNNSLSRKKRDYGYNVIQNLARKEAAEAESYLRSKGPKPDPLSLDNLDVFNFPKN